MTVENKRRTLVVIALVVGLAIAATCVVLAQPDGPVEAIPFGDLVRRGELEADLMRWALWLMGAISLTVGGLVWRDGSRHSSVKSLRDSQAVLREEVRELRRMMWEAP